MNLELETSPIFIIINNKNKTIVSKEGLKRNREERERETEIADERENEEREISLSFTRRPPQTTTTHRRHKQARRAPQSDRAQGFVLRFTDPSPWIPRSHLL
jgi:hypothetical protein